MGSENGKGREVWEKTDEERGRAFMYFSAYRDMGPARTLKKAARATGKSTALMRKLSTRFNWTFRADQYDAWVQRLKDRTVRGSVERQAAVEARAVSDFVRSSAILARRLLRRVREKEGLVMGPKTVAMMLDVGVKLQRLLRGETTDRREVISADAKDELLRRLSRVSRHRAKPEEEEAPSPEAD